MSRSKNNIKAVIIEANGQLIEKKIHNDLRALQKIVDGFIEVVPFEYEGTPFLVVCNEEGRLEGRPYNCTINGVDFVGDIILLGEDGEEFADVPQIVADNLLNICA